MEPTSTYRPRVSRETRRLLTTAVLAVAALWLLARIRFEERPVTPNPVPAFLGQLGITSGSPDLAESTALVRARVERSIVALTLAPDGVTDAGAPAVAGFRFRGDLAVALAPPAARAHGPAAPRVAVHDPSTALTVVHAAGWAPESVPPPWTPRRPQPPLYLMATEVFAGRVTLRPVFVGGVEPVASTVWSGPLWAVPPGTGLTPGAFVFTGNAELVGLVVAHHGPATAIAPGAAVGTAIVPGATVLALAERLLAQPNPAPSSVGIEVQALTPELAAATGASSGVVVAWVHAPGPAAAVVNAGDVIEAAGGQAVVTPLDWTTRVARLAEGEALPLRIRRRGQVQDVAVTAVAPPIAPPPERAPVGLTLERRAEAGAVIVRVESGSAAELAGLAAGDLITLAGDIAAPTPAQVLRTLAAAKDGQPVMLAVTRDRAHRVLVLTR